MMEQDNNDELLNQFFKDNKKEIEDFGFSRRVIRKLPGHEKKIVNLWIAFCSLVGIALFYFFDGVGVFTNLATNLYDSFIHSELITTNPSMIFTAVGAGLFLLVRRFWSVE